MQTTRRGSFVFSSSGVFTGLNVPPLNPGSRKIDRVVVGVRAHFSFQAHPLSRLSRMTKIHQENHTAGFGGTLPSSGNRRATGVPLRLDGHTVSFYPFSGAVHMWRGLALISSVLYPRWECSPNSPQEAGAASFSCSIHTWYIFFPIF